MLVVIVNGLCLAGCATTSVINSGANLAKVGQTTAIQMGENITLSENSIVALKKAVAFNDGYNGVAGNPGSETFLTNIESIQSKLDKYGSMIDKLSSSYSALGDLAGYNAVSNFNSSIDSLATSATNFASAIGKTIVIPTEVKSGVNTIGGFVLGAVQAENVKNASQQIEVVLKQVINVLDDPGTKAKLIPVQKEVEGQISQAADVLYFNGVYSYGPLLDELGSPLGFKSTSTSDSIVTKNDKIKKGLNYVAVEIAQEQVIAQGTSYDKSLAALKALIPLHESLQKGAPLNMNTVLNIINQLQDISTSIQPVKEK